MRSKLAAIVELSIGIKAKVEKWKTDGRPIFEDKRCRNKWPKKIPLTTEDERDRLVQRFNYPSQSALAAAGPRSTARRGACWGACSRASRRAASTGNRNARRSTGVSTSRSRNGDAGCPTRRDRPGSRARRGYSGCSLGERRRRRAPAGGEGSRERRLRRSTAGTGSRWEIPVRSWAGHGPAGWYR